MTTAVDIANRALSLIGTRSTIASLDEASTEAINAQTWYASTRDELLRMAHWNFAKKTANLTLLKAASGTPENPTPAASAAWDPSQPPPGWLYSYAYPSDCLLLRRIVPMLTTALLSSTPLTAATSSLAVPYNASAPPVRFSIATDTDASGNPVTVILTNQQQAIGEYTTRIVVEDAFDALFIESMSFALAAKFVINMAGDKTLANMLFGMANKVVTQARATDGSEGLTVMQSLPDWIKVRGIAADWAVAGGFYGDQYAPLYAVSY